MLRSLRLGQDLVTNAARIVERDLVTSGVDGQGLGATWNSRHYQYDGRVSPATGTFSSTRTKFSFIQDHDNVPDDDAIRTPDWSLPGGRTRSVRFGDSDTEYDEILSDDESSFYDDVTDTSSVVSSKNDELSPDANRSHDMMPAHDVVLREFEEYLEARSPVKEDVEKQLRLKSIEEKWQLIFNVAKEPFHSPQVYVEELTKYTEGAHKKHSTARRSAHTGSGSLSYWLKKLKLDLKCLSPSFVQDFVSSPRNGLSHLLGVLKQIQRDQEKLQTIRKSKIDLLKQAQLDEYDCLLCIKFALKSSENVQLLLTSINSPVDVIASCLMSTFRKTTVVTIEILTSVCDVHVGHNQVLDAMTVVRVKTMESFRFKLIVNILHGVTANQHFQAVCVRFFNKLLSCTDDANAKVYLQYELLQAGFEPDSLKKHSLAQTTDYDELQAEVEVWRKNYINVENSQQELFEIQGRNTYLRSEIDRLQDSIKDIERKQADTEKDKTVADVRLDRHSEKIVELQDTLGRLVNLFEERTGDDPSDDIKELKNYYKPLDGFATVRDNLSSSKTRQLQLGSLGSSSASHTVPDAPPLIPPDFLSKTVRHKFLTHGNLPTLGWTPLNSIKGTLFEDIDDEAKLREIDFSDFDKAFQLPSKELESRDLGERILQSNSKKISFMDMARARNMIITMKRTNLEPVELKDAIDKFQMDKLSGECAELLIKFIPNSSEVAKLNENRAHYHKFGKAEQYLHQMTKVDRLERKLSLMAFIGKFDDIVESVRPKVEDVRVTSESILRSTKLKKLFELVLAFGNYMNGNRKGYALGFRLKSLSKLSEVRARDSSKQSLLHFLVQLIEDQYPELSDFDQELELQVDKGVSFQSITSDVLGLRKGMDQIRLEREKQQNNTILDNFYTKASAVAVDIFDGFRKMEDAYKNVCVYFGEKHREIEPDELFKYLADFVASFKHAIEENHKRSNSQANPPGINVSNRVMATNSPRSATTSPRGPVNKAVLHKNVENKLVNGHTNTSNLDTPSKSKPVKDKVITDINGDDPNLIYDDTLPPVPPKLWFSDNIYDDVSHNYTASSSNDTVGNRTAPVIRTSSHVTKVNVSQDHDIVKSEDIYSEIPANTKPQWQPERVTLQNGGHLSPRGASFFYGVKADDIRAGERPQPRGNVSKAPSYRDGTGGNFRKTKSSADDMIVKRISVLPEDNTNRRDLTSTEPIYDDVAGADSDSPTSARYNFNVDSESWLDSECSSLSSPSLSTRSLQASRGTPLASSNLTNSHKVNGITTNGAGNNHVYRQDFDDAINRLDRVLDDAASGGVVAAEDENTSL